MPPRHHDQAIDVTRTAFTNSILNNTVGLVIALFASVFAWQSRGAVQCFLLAGVGSVCQRRRFFLTSMRDGDASFVVPFKYSMLLFASVRECCAIGDAPDSIGLLSAGIHNKRCNIPNQEMSPGYLFVNSK